MAQAQVSQAQEVAIWRKQFAQAKNDSVRAEFGNRLQQAYQPYDNDSCRYFAELTMRYAKNLKNKDIYVKACSELADTYDRQGNTKKAFEILSSAEKLPFSTSPPDTALIYLKYRMAILHLRRNDMVTSLPLALQAYRLFERVPNRAAVPILDFNLAKTLGVLYSELKDYPKSNSYYLHAYEVAKRIKRKTGQILALNNIATNYVNANDYDKAEELVLQALALTKGTYDLPRMHVMPAYVGILIYKKQFAKALEFARENLALQKTLSDVVRIADAYNMLSEIHLNLKNYDKALICANEAVCYMENTAFTRKKGQSYKAQANVFEQTGRFQEALAAFKVSKAIEDSLADIDRAKEVARIQAGFDLERKQNQITLLNKNVAIQLLQKQKQQRQLRSLAQLKLTTELKNKLLTEQQLVDQHQLGIQKLNTKRQQSQIMIQQQQLDFARQRQLLYLTILAMLAILVILIGYFLQRQRRARRLLATQKEEIQQQAQQLGELNTTKDKLFSLISHDLRSPLAALKTNVDQLHTLPQSQNPLLAQVTQQVEYQLDRVLDLLTNLLTWSHSQLKGFRSMTQPLAVREILAQELAQLSQQLVRKQVRVMNHVDADLLVDADRHQLGAVIRNLLMNALKFSSPGGFIRVSTTRHESQVEIQIRDGGTGMSQAQLSVLFSQPQVSVGTNGEQGTGLGLRLCKDLLTQQGGSLAIESELGRGTTARIRLPLAQTELLPESLNVTTG
ncbi:tetratricopeptide repeat-containing sensor histidine kinase [Spirosoma oryzae]|nr:tetratricopeptide repeat-containing sensor histidine kinase [Spirosoma oryzae]